MEELASGSPPSQALHQGLPAPGASPLVFVGIAVGQARCGQAEKSRLGPGRDGGGFLAGGSPRAGDRGCELLRGLPRVDEGAQAQHSSASSARFSLAWPKGCPRHMGVCGPAKLPPQRGEGVLCTCGGGALSCWSQSFCPCSANAALGQTLLLEVLPPTRGRTGPAVQGSVPGSLLGWVTAWPPHPL